MIRFGVWIAISLTLSIYCRADNENVVIVTNMNGQRSPPMIFESINTTNAASTKFAYYETEEFSTNAVLNTKDNTYTYTSLLFQFLVQLNITDGTFINTFSNGAPQQLNTVETGGAVFLGYDTIWQELFAVISANRGDPFIVSVDPVTGSCTTFMTLSNVHFSFPNLEFTPDYYSKDHLWYVWDKHGNLLQIDMQAKSFNFYQIPPSVYPRLGYAVYVDQNSGIVYANGLTDSANYTIFQVEFISSTQLNYQLIFEFSEGFTGCDGICDRFQCGTFDSDSQLLYLIGSKGFNGIRDFLFTVNVQTGELNPIGNPPPALYMWMIKP